MKTYAIHYIPYWGSFTRYCEYIKASNSKVAEMKFYLKNDNCQEIILIERV